MDKKFLHKVLDQLVRETRIDYGEKIIYFPFFSMLITHFKIIFNTPEIPQPLTFLQVLYDHCNDVYGLNEKETDYVYEEYIGIIKNKLKKGEEFLNKVVDQLVNETRIDYENERVYSPFLLTFFSSFFLSLLPLPYSPPVEVSDHCKNVYGLTRKEIKYVWENYVIIIKDKIEKG